MSEETATQNIGDGSGNSVAPEDILPLFFTSKTQQIFGCIADEDVNAENPHKLILKETILQDFKERAAVSDFHPAKSIVLVCILCTYAYITFKTNKLINILVAALAHNNRGRWGTIEGKIV